MSKLLLVVLICPLLLLGCFGNTPQKTKFANTDKTFGEILDNYKYFTNTTWDGDIARSTLNIEELFGLSPLSNSLEQFVIFKKNENKKYEIDRIYYIYSRRNPEFSQEIPGVNPTSIMLAMSENKPIIDDMMQRILKQSVVDPIKNVIDGLIRR